MVDFVVRSNGFLETSIYFHQITRLHLPDDNTLTVTEAGTSNLTTLNSSDDGRPSVLHSGRLGFRALSQVWYSEQKTLNLGFFLR
jgi:hypothetical protein